jgi:hypothetical protein
MNALSGIYWRVLWARTLGRHQETSIGGGRSEMGGVVYCNEACILKNTTRVGVSIAAIYGVKNEGQGERWG